MTEENCGNCYFWLNGECRFTYPDPEHGWPKTNSTDWCGDYEEAEEEEAVPAADPRSGFAEAALGISLPILCIGAYLAWLNWETVVAWWEWLQ